MLSKLPCCVKLASDSVHLSLRFLLKNVFLLYIVEITASPSYIESKIKPSIKLANGMLTNCCFPFVVHHLTDGAVDQSHIRIASIGSVQSWLASKTAITHSFWSMCCCHALADSGTTAYIPAFELWPDIHDLLHIRSWIVSAWSMTSQRAVQFSCLHIDHQLQYGLQLH